MRAVKASVCLVLLLAGCGGLLHETTPTVWLALEPPPAVGGLRTGGSSLEVLAFATAAPFATDRVVSREGASRWSFAAYHRWIAEPGEMVAARLREALSRADLFKAVITPPALLDADWRLGGAVRALYWDRENRSAVLEVEVSLVQTPDRLCGFWVHHAAVPVSGDTVEAFLAAASTAEGQVFAALRDDLAAALAAAPAR